MHKDIFIFGDSITQGFYDTNFGGWPSLLFATLNERTLETKIKDFFSVFNLGISGNTVKEVLNRFESDLKPRAQEKEGIVILDIGGNDSTRNVVTGENVCPFDEFSKQYSELITLAKKYGDVVCIGIHDSDTDNLSQIPWWENHGIFAEDAIRYDDEVCRLAHEHGVVYVPMRGLLAQDYATYSADGDHPNAAGHDLIFERVKSSLEAEGLL
jgi:lysophospholipase L1-like esterase